MLEQTFFCIRPYIFEKREMIKKIISNSELVIKESKIIWLAQDDIRVIYEHEEPSAYFDANLYFMTKGFSEAGIIEGEDVMSRLIEVASSTHIPSESGPTTLRAIFGKTNPVDFNGFNYYLNPLHRSCTKQEVEATTSFYWNTLKKRTPVEIISDMMWKLHYDKNLECVYEYHIKMVVQIALELCDEFGGDKKVVELATWLHDIASLKSNKKHEHHIEGANDVEKILKLLGYGNEIIQNVKYCIQSHRGSKALAKMTQEADIVCSADGLANLHYAPLLYFFAFKIGRLGFIEGIEKIKRKVESSYMKIGNFAKYKAKTDYEAWKNLL